MRWSDVMIDIETGNPIVAGEIVLALGKRLPIEMPAHSHVLLDFERRQKSTLTCRAITGMTRLASGFYSVTTAEPRLYLQALWRDSFESYVGRDTESHAAFRASNCGNFYRERDALFEIAGLELVRRLQPGGLSFRITGAFAAMPGADAIKLPDQHAGFEVSGLIPWGTLQLYEFAGAYHHSDFVPEPAESHEEPLHSLHGADSLALADLRFSHEGPLVAGHLKFSGAPPRAKHAAPWGVTLRCNAAGLSLATCYRVGHGAERGLQHRQEREPVLDWRRRLSMSGEGNGDTDGENAIRFRSAPITFSWIEQLLHERDRATVGLAGDGIGEVTHETGAMVEAGLREIVCIGAERLDFEAVLSKAGLQIKLDAALSKVRRRSVGISAFKPEPNSFQSLFTAVATLPWSHLLVMGSSLAERREAAWRGEHEVTR
jgi:hypothetical protein